MQLGVTPARVVTSGTLEHAIVLPFEGAPPYTLQGMLDRWSGQYAPQALVTHRGVVWLQLERYMYAAAKNRQTVRVRPGDQVAVPIFSESTGLSIQHESFTVAALIYHLGDTTQSGHYLLLCWGSLV